MAKKTKGTDEVTDKLLPREAIGFAMFAVAGCCVESSVAAVIAVLGLLIAFGDKIEWKRRGKRGKRSRTSSVRCSSVK